MALTALVPNLPTRWHYHLVTKFGSNATNSSAIEINLEIFNLNFLVTEFDSFVAGKIIQVIEAMPGSVVPLAMFANRIKIWSSGDITSKVRRLSTRLSHLHCHIALLTLSVSIKLVSLSARVTSVKFQKGVSLS